MRQGSSGLTLREYQVYHKPVFELTPKKVAQWVKNLPMANLGESSKSTYRLLVDTNQTLMDPDKRLNILDTLELVSHELVTSLEKQFINNRIALNEKQRKIAALVQAIQTELSIGYHSVIESIIAEQVKRSNRKLLAKAIFMAINYHGLVIVRCYQLYASIPRRIWRELYSLFQIAKQYELENLPIKLTVESGTSSIQDKFTQILLLTIANPYQLRQRDINLLWQILPELTAHVSLKSHAYNKHHYIVPLAQASPPVHKSLVKPKEGDRNYKLTAFTAVEKLNQMLVENKQSGQQNVRYIMLIRHLIQSWNHGTHRAFARTGCSGHADISFGLGATHYHLKEDYQQENNKSETDSSNPTLDAMEGSLKNATISEVAQSKNKQSKSSFDYLSSSGPPSSDVWGKLYQTEKEKERARYNELEQQKNNRTKDSIVRDSYKFQNVELLNMSPNGYCIQITSEDLPNHAQTGEILGFLEQDNHQIHHWSIGVVRWVRRQPKGNMVQMGVQLLAPGATPINVQLRNSRSDNNDYQRALILPALTGVGQPQTMLTNPLAFSTNSKVRILDNGEEYDARLSKELTSTGSYRQFCFERLGGSAKPPKNEDKNTPPLDPDELDGVWDLI